MNTSWLTTGPALATQNHDDQVRTSWRHRGNIFRQSGGKRPGICPCLDIQKTIHLCVLAAKWRLSRSLSRKKRKCFITRASVQCKDWVRVMWGLGTKSRKFSVGEHFTEKNKLIAFIEWQWYHNKFNLKYKDQILQREFNQMWNLIRSPLHR